MTLVNVGIDFAANIGDSALDTWVVGAPLPTSTPQALPEYLDAVETMPEGIA